jgi:hypothetical protein
MAYVLGAASRRLVSFPTRKGQRGDTSSSFLYIISEGEHGPVKVGRSRNPGARISELQTGNARRLRVVVTYEFTHNEACDAERLLHEALSEFALAGEWFDVDEKFMAEYMPDFFLSEGLEPKNGAHPID